MTNVKLSVKGVQKMIDEVANYHTWLLERTKLFIRRLGDEGVTCASAKFENAKYSGKNDVSVTLEERSDMSVAVVAIGEATLFIEFGTGVHTYPDIHPEAHDLGMIRGEYGKKRGQRETWGYYGDPGNLGTLVNEETGLVLTKGSPASMPMYETVKELESRIEAIAREVFT